MPGGAGSDAGTLLLSIWTGPKVKEGVWEFPGPSDRGTLREPQKPAFLAISGLPEPGLTALGTVLGRHSLRKHTPTFENRKESRCRLLGRSKVLKSSQNWPKNTGVPGSSGESGTPGWHPDIPRAGPGAISSGPVVVPRSYARYTNPTRHAMWLSKSPPVVS